MIARRPLEPNKEQPLKISSFYTAYPEIRG